MVTPPRTPYSQIPGGGVYTNDGSHYYIKSDDTLAIQMDNGAQITGTNPATAFIYLPGAALVP